MGVPIHFAAGRGGANIAHALGGALVGYNIRADRNNSTRPDASLTAFSLVGGGTLTMSRITDWNDPQSVIRAGATCFEMPEVQAGNNATWLNYVFCAGSSGACTSDPAPLSEKLCP